MDWYEEEVEQLIYKRDQLQYPPRSVFYGSSSIRLWESLYQDFEIFSPVNLGFGGSTLEACVYFFNRIVVPVQSAQKLIVYAGDNDLGDGRSPENVLYSFQQLEALITAYLPSVSCYYMSVKPSISRWNINHNILEVNRLIKEEITGKSNLSFIDIYPAMLNEEGTPNATYFDDDGLHLSEQGYAVWKQILLAQVFADR